MAVISLSPLAAQTAAVIEHDVSADLESGYLDNQQDVERIVFRDRVGVDGASILRLHFGTCNLPTGSRIEITSLLDGDMQRLDGLSLVDYANSSAYFNGSEVEIKLIAGPGTKANRIQLDHLTSTKYPIGESICGDFDDRVRSFDRRQGRLSSGCTGWMIGNSMALSAGHCGSTGRNMLLSFNVPLSSTSGQLRASAVVDQYPYHVLAAAANGVGSDWGLARVSRNSNSGLFPPEAYGEGFYELAPPPQSSVGQNIRITGYGSVPSDGNLPRTLNQVQKSHLGPANFFSTTSLSYRTDTTGGNSGSPIVLEESGRAIGIHTHGGCTGGGANNGTRIDFTDLLSAMTQFAGELPHPFAAETFGTGCAGSFGVGTLDLSGLPVIGNIFSLDMDNLPVGLSGVMFMGRSRTQWVDTGLSLPLDLELVGAPGCDLLVSPDRGFVKDTFIGRTNLVLTVPADVSLIGLNFYWQYIYPDLFIGGLLRTTNAVEMTIGG